MLFSTVIMKENRAILLFASGEKSSDMRYLSGLATPDDFIAFQINGEVYAVLSALEYDRGKENAAANCHVLRESELGGPDRMTIFQSIAKDFRVKEFVVAKDFPLFWADKLRARGLKITTCDGELLPEREFKTSSEAEKLAAAEKAAQNGLLRAKEILASSKVDAQNRIIYENAVLTSEILRAEIDCALIISGMLPTGTICAGSTQSAQPHNPGSGPLYANTPIVIDIFPKSITTGYWGDLTRTLVKGKAPDIVKAAHRAVCEAKKSAISMLAIGAIPAEIHFAAEKILSAHGFFTGRNDAGDFGFFHSLGHGVGLDIHEAPRLSPRNRTPLRGGEAVTIEPGLYYPEWGGIRQEDLLYITPNGDCVDLTDLPDTLEIE